MIPRMTEADFTFLRLLLQQRSGLSLTADKRYLAESRLGILCRRRGVADIEALVRELRLSRDPGLESAVVDAMRQKQPVPVRKGQPPCAMLLHVSRMEFGRAPRGRQPPLRNQELKTT